VTARRRHVSHGRPKKERGLDQFDTPPKALEPLFEHEPLLRGVTAVCEPFCGTGQLVIPLRRDRGLIVHASDIADRGCPDSTVLDFGQMTERPAGCTVMLTNPAFDGAMGHIEHGWNLGFRLIILLLSTNFLHSAERFERLHKTGHLRRMYPLVERLQGMHDAAHVANGGKLGSQPNTHSWFVIDKDYCGPTESIPVSIDRPSERMPWARQRLAQCLNVACPNPSFVPSRADAKFCSAACRQRAFRERASRHAAVTSSNGKT